MKENEWIVQVIRWMKEGKRKVFRRKTDELQPYDLGVIYQELPAKHRTKYLQFLGRERTVELIQELPNEDRLDILGRIEPKMMTYVLDHMDKDDLAQLLDGLMEEEVAYYLNKMDSGESETVQNLLNYPPESAGRLMTDKFIRVSKESTVRNAVDKMKVYAHYSETIHYLYVVDEEKKLVGVVSYRDLILADENERIADIMFNRVISVQVNDDQEAVASLIEKYDFLAVPVVEADGELLGIVTIDDALDVIIKEANEDFEKLSATGKDIDFHTKAFKAATKRLPWLILLLFVGLLTGSLMSHFEQTIQQVVVLTYFLPLIAGTTGNTGTQSLALTVRGLLQHDGNPKTIQRLLLRELGVGFYMGIVCGLLVCAIAYVWQGSLALGLVIGLSLLISLVAGTLTGTVIPLLLRRFGLDPAVASGPFITTLNDILSMSVYFGLATHFIEWLI